MPHGRQTCAYLEGEKKARPELAGFLDEMEAITGRIDAAVAKEIRTRTRAMLRNPTGYEAPRH
jgi:hypothetical protein